MSYTTLFLVIATTLLGVAGDAMLKISGQGPRTVNSMWLVAGAVLWILTIPCWFFLFKQTKLINIGIVYVLTNLIALTLLGIVYFKEKITGAELVGLALAFITIILLKRFG